MLIFFIMTKFILFTAFMLYNILLETSGGDFYGIKITDTAQLVGNLRPTVDLKQGTLEGSSELSRDGRLFVSFKNIPFGKVKERFNNAEPADSWKGTRQAKTYGPVCPQVDLFTKQYSGQEDCLSLNVFVPHSENTKKNETLPVMFYIYGGAFLNGDASIYKPKYFMDEDVILVIPNYRLGAFGFLNAGVKGASGNQAMSDLILALKWVQDNISVFGGDQNRVTIFGCSAGGALTSHLVVSPQAKGLFSAAIPQSGAAAIGWALWSDEEFDEPKKLAHAVDCPTSDRKYMVECLRNIKPEIIAAASASKEFVGFDREKSPVFHPSIEIFRDGENNFSAFIPENVETMYDEGNFNMVPLLIGITSHEGISLHAAPIALNQNFTRRMNEEWGRVLPQTMFFWKIARDPCKVSSKLKDTYFGEKPVGLDTFEGLTDLYSDVAFRYPARKVGVKHAKFAPVYMYNFTREVGTSFGDLFGLYKNTNISTKYPAHGDDVQYLFNGLMLWPEISKESGADYEFSKNYVKFLTSFARDHKPTHLWGSKQKEPVKSVDPMAEKIDWIEIDNELRVEPESDEVMRRLNVLDEICRDDYKLCSPVKKLTYTFPGSIMGREIVKLGNDNIEFVFTT